MDNDQAYDLEMKVKRQEKRIKELEAAARDILDCPFSVDEATVPRAGIAAAPHQVVLNVSMAYLKRERLAAALDGKPE